MLTYTTFIFTTFCSRFNPIMSKQPEDQKEANFGKQFRHSLQPKSSIENVDSGFRHTQSQRYENTGRKKEKKSVVLTVIPDSVEISIPEDQKAPPKRNRSRTDSVPALERHASKTSKSSKDSRRSETDKALYAFQNQAFDEKFDKRSISSSRAGSSRAPSVQSLEYVVNHNLYG